MLVREFYKARKDGVNLYRSYSDKNFKIKQVETNTILEEAIDPEDKNYTYEETKQLIEQEANELELKAQAYDILIGEVE